MTDAAQKFAQLFSDYMARPESDKPKSFKPLSDFLESLKFEELRDCLSTYVTVSTHYADNDRYVLDVFFKLASLALTHRRSARRISKRKLVGKVTPT